MKKLIVGETGEQREGMQGIYQHVPITRRRNENTNRVDVGQRF